jgi:hypothetical protein
MHDIHQIKKHQSRKSDSGKRVFGQGKINLNVSIRPDFLDYLQRAGNGRQALGLERVGKFLIENIPADEFHE